VPGLRIYIPQEQGGPVISQALGSLFVASYDSQGYGGIIRTRLLAGRSVKLLLASPAQSFLASASSRSITKFLLSRRHVRVSKWGLLSDEGGVGFSM
jgi:hypothetical protein